MTTFLIVFQFERHSIRPWSQSRIQQAVARHGATYVSRGVYIALASGSAEQLRDEIIAAAELTERDFIGVYPIGGDWSSLGHSQRGSAQPEWPTEGVVSESQRV